LEILFLTRFKCRI